MLFRYFFTFFLILSCGLQALAAAFELPQRVVIDRDAGWTCRIPAHLTVIDCFRPIFGGGNSNVGWLIDHQTPDLPSWLASQVEQPQAAQARQTRQKLKVPFNIRLVHHHRSGAGQASEPSDLPSLLDAAMPQDMVGLPASDAWIWSPVDLTEHYRAVSKGLERTLPRGSVAWDGQTPDRGLHCRLVVSNDLVIVLLVTGLDPISTKRVLDSLEPLDRRGRTWTARQSARNIIQQRNEDEDAAQPLTWTKLNGLPRQAPPSMEQAFHLETEHYLLVAQVGPQKLLRLASVLEGLDNAYRTVFRAEDDLAICKPIVIIAHDFITYAALSAEFGINVGGPHMGSVIHGYFNPGRFLMVTYAEPLPNSSSTVEGVLAHECTHQFVHLMCNGSSHVPLWLNEGLAVYFENIEVTGNKWRWSPPKDRLGRLLDHYKRTKRTLRPLAYYLDPNKRSMPAEEYAEAYAMVHFWLFASPDGRKLFTNYWKALQHGMDGRQAFIDTVLDKLAPNNGGDANAVLQSWEENYYDTLKPAN